MDIYADMPVHDRSTGKFLKNELTKVSRRCDYCGRDIDDENEDVYVEVEFEQHEVGGSEESYYYHDNPEPDIKFDVRKVFTEHEKYIYCTEEDGESCSGKMIMNAAAAGHCSNLESVMQIARLAAVGRLLKNGSVTVKELNIQED